MTKAELHTKTEKIAQQSRLAYLLLIAGLLFVTLAPYLFTRFSWFRGMDFSNSGQIGDTIGGITAPFINLIAVVLIYFSFRQQLLSNEIQIGLINNEKEERIKAKELELIHLAYTDLKNYLDNFQYVFEKTSIKDMKTVEAVYIGEDAIYHLIKVIKQHKGRLAYRNQHNAIKSLVAILQLVDTIIQKLDNPRLHKTEKHFLMNQLSTFFQIKLVNHLNTLFDMKDPDTEIIELLATLQATSNKLSEKNESFVR